MKPVLDRHANHSNATRNGFTLVEVLVGLTILCLLVFLLASLIGGVGDTWKKAKGRADNHAKARFSLDLIERDLNAAIIGRGLAGFGVSSPPEVLAFHSAQAGLLPPYASGTNVSARPLSLVSFRVIDDGTNIHDFGLQRGLMGYAFSDVAPFSTNVFPSPAASLDSSLYEVIGPGVLRMAIRYLGSNGIISRTFEWPQQEGSPRTVAVIISLLVLDEETLRWTQDNDTYKGFLQRLDSIAVSDSEVPSDLWREALEKPEVFSGLSGSDRIRSALKVYGRIIRIPTS